MKNEIIRWKPFLASYISYDGSKQVTVTFRCPHCGSRSCDRRTKDTHNRPDDRHFFSGVFSLAYAFGYGKSTESASASRTGYIAGAMYMADEIVKDIASLRDNYMRQLQGRPTEAFAFIAGKVEAANMILEILKKYK